MTAKKESRKEKLKRLTTKNVETLELSTEQKEVVNDISKEYLKNYTQQKSDGWDEYWIYARPSNRHIGSLTKITFKVGKKELSEDEVLEAIKVEVMRRLQDGDSYFLGGIRTFIEDDLFYKIESDRDFILSNFLDNKQLFKELEMCTEYPKINELFQRIKDYEHNEVTYEIKREFLCSFRKKI